MGINVKIAFHFLHVIVSAILIFSILIMTYRQLVWSQLFLIFYFIISILITSFLIKSDSLMYSVLSGMFIGILSGLFFFLYFYIPAQNSPVRFEWSLFYALSFSFTIIWIFSCMIGGVISYFMRKFIKGKITTKSINK